MSVFIHNQKKILLIDLNGYEVGNRRFPYSGQEYCSTIFLWNKLKLKNHYDKNISFFIIIMFIT